ncbi:hypothetical protein SDRG_01845 [Saprolegnia diclina VS20]|uniref:Uncharacterized protein n=1 Tax=Saprolegnia diclina (strain VS20) TaxID=1156394 RepID=T0QRK5_SAPDV|nr:hypothetical protein SDRG_01845 [Saprolegnia diclina VS20]EQC40774.1 hypothetical protein SDRG_01845 [Saprolegnia diclina VS20]|eukprot:XP_008605618.1 hypothetical protein SDRG_01845 [Saprolegnia diclina VS20]
MSLMMSDALGHPTSPRVVFSPRKALARLQVQPAPSSALGALAESEKDAVILYLLQKVRDQQAMQDATIKFGEQVAAQLVLEQVSAILLFDFSLPSSRIASSG